MVFVGDGGLKFELCVAEEGEVVVAEEVVAGFVVCKGVGEVLSSVVLKLRIARDGTHYSSISKAYISQKLFVNNTQRPRQKYMLHTLTCGTRLNNGREELIRPIGKRLSGTLSMFMGGQSTRQPFSFLSNTKNNSGQS